MTVAGRNDSCQVDGPTGPAAAFIRRGHESFCSLHPPSVEHDERDGRTAEFSSPASHRYLTVGSFTRPMNRASPLDSSRNTKRNGWSAVNSPSF